MGVAVTLHACGWISVAGVRGTAGGEAVEAEGDAGVRPSLWLGAGAGEAGNRVGTQWLAPAGIYTCGEKTREICQGFVAAVLALGFFSGEGGWGPLQSSSLGTKFIRTAWLIRVVPALLPCSWLSVSLSFAALWVGCLESQGSCVLTCSALPGGGTPSSSVLCAEQCRLGDGTRQAK